MDLINIGIGGQYRPERSLGEIMHFRRRNLSFQTPDNRSGEYDVTDGAEANN
jgi:hypothetical protein